MAGRHPTQASLEARLAETWRRFERGDVTVAEAFGDDDDWLLLLGGVQLRLHPVLKRWYVYRRVDGWWADTGHGPGEVLFVPVGRGLGEKLLPPGEPRDVAAWCLLRHGDELVGPVPVAEATRRLVAGELSSDALVWTATATGWRPASEALGEGAARPAPAGPDPAPDPAGVARVEEPARPAPAREAAAPVGAESTRARFCIRCGAPFADDARFCVRCGRERR